MADGKVVIEIDAESKGFEKGLESVQKTASQLANNELRSVETAANAVSASFQSTASAATAAGSTCEGSLRGVEAVLKNGATAAGAMADALKENADAAEDAADAARDVDDAIREETRSKENNTDSTEENTKSQEENTDSTKDGTKATEDYAKANEQATKVLKFTVAAVTAVASAMAAGVAAAVAAGSQYESAFAQVQTIMDANVMSAQEMSGAIINLSNETGAAATNLSESVYNAISATGDTANAVSLVADASKLATAGFAEEGDALGVLSTIMNAYGMSASEATAISDSLIQTQNLGVTTVGQLASSMGKAIATASAYSVDLHNLESSYVSLTKAGISTEESTTYLSSMFNELGDAGSTVASVIQNKTGKSFGQLMQAGYSLGDVLEILLDSVNGDTEALMNLWGSAEAGKAASAIAGQGIQTFNSNLEQLRTSAGATETAYETMTQTLSFQTDLLKTRITNLGTAVYSYFDDALTEGVSSLSDAFLALSESVTDGELADEMEQIGQGVSDLISTGAELVADVLPGIIEGAAWILDNGGTIATVIGGVTASIVAYKAATLIATIATEGLNAVIAISPWGAAAAAVGLLITAFAALGSQTARLTDEQQSAIDGAERAASAADTLAESIRGVEDAYNGTKDAVESSADTNDKMISSLARLVDGYDGTAASAAEIRNIIDQLNSSIPGLNLEFDEQTGLLNKTEAAMRALNREYAAQQNYDAAISKRTEAEKNRADAVEGLESAQKAYNDALDAATAYEDTYSGSMVYNTKTHQELRNAVDQASAALTQARANYDNASGAVRTARLEVETYGAELNAAASDAEQFSTETEGATDVLSAEADAAATATTSIAQIGQDAYTAVQSGQNLRDTYEELRGKLDELTGTGDPYIESLAEQNLKMLEIAATNQELSESYSYLAETSGVSLSTLSGWLIDSGLTADEWASQVNSAKDNVINGFQELDTSLDMSLQDMAASLRSNIDAYTNWNTNIQILMAAAVETGSQSAIDFVMYMQEMGVGAADQVQMMVDDIDGTMDTFPPLFEEATAAGMAEVYNGIEGGKGKVASAASGMMDDVISEVEGADTEGAGSDAGGGIDSGMESQRGNIQSTAQELADTVTNTWTSSNGAFQNSGSEAGTQIKIGLMLQKESVTTAAQALADGVNNAWKSTAAAFRESGTTAAGLIAEGISNTANEITSAAGNAAQGAYSAMRDVDWYSLGYNISAGVASGVRGGSSLITSAARSAAQSALAAAKAELGVASPSKVFRDEVGKMIPAGIAVGIQAETPALTASMESATDTLLEKAKIAVRPTVDTGYAQQHITNIQNNISRSVTTGAQENTSEQLSLLRRIAEGVNSEGTVINLTFPDGTKLASYLFQPFANYAKANGTPIINPS